jgi:hypothetical protein
MDDGGGRALLREAWPEVTGRPGPTQGRYRAAGDLETEDSRTHTAEERRDR